MNLEQVNTFLSLIYPCDSSWVAMCLIPPRPGSPEHRFMEVGQLSRFLGYARYRNAHGWGIYLTPSVLKPKACNRRKESFEHRQSVIYLDCDQPRCLVRIKRRYPYPTLVVQTSKGRHQVYWRLDQDLDVRRQQRLMSAMAADVDADRAATDVSRVLRLPSFWNRKPGRNNTVNIVFSRDHAVPYQSLLERAHPSGSNDNPATRCSSTPSNQRRVLVDPGSAPTRSSQGPTASERDWWEVHRRLALGHSAHDVVHWLQAKRTDKRNPAYYARLTVSKAVAAHRIKGKPYPQR